MAKEVQLTARKVATIKEPGYYLDGRGLYLQVTPGKDKPAKSWVLRYKRNGRVREMGLGPVADRPLAEARKKAAECRRQVQEGIDPINERRAQRVEEAVKAAKRLTFEEATDRYLKAHADGWKNEKHRAQWRSTLKTYAFPVMGTLPVDAIELPHVLKVLEPIWKDKTETASRLRGRIERVLSWATVRGYRSGENPARWKGHLSEMLPASNLIARIKHHAALPYDEAPAFMAELRAREGISARALELTILTALRTSEVIEAKWDEIDLASGVWTVPAERMKAKKEHQVPLSGRVIDVLRSLPRLGEYVFPGVREGRSLSNMAMLELLRAMRDGLTVHGFRSTFRDWAGDQTNFASEVVEHALAHKLPDKVERAYRRSSALEKRRRVMDAWARYCDSPPAKNKGKIVSIRAA